MTVRALSLVAIGGTLLAVAYPLGARARTIWRESAAAERLVDIAEAQKAFRAGPGHGGYATSLTSLTTACPEGGPAVFAATLTGERIVARGYEVVLRAYRQAPAAGVDCHGRPTAQDFLASASPVRVGIDGLRAMSVSAAGRVFVFFDGVAPREADMEPGGLAMPLDDLRRIP